MVIVLLGTLLLAGLIFYVVNVGGQVNNRLGMQNAADSAAISGATWMARSMNLIAMNNIAQTRMLTLVPILDSFPLATAMTYDETTQWCQALEAAQARGVQSPYALEQQFIANSLVGLDTDMRVQVLILQNMNTLFNDSASGYDVKSLTFWSIDGQAGPPPHGQLWQAARALADMNGAVNDTSGLLSQSNAVRYGREDGAQTSFLVPVLPDKPGRQGSYGDFWLPIRGHSSIGVPEGTIPDRYSPFTPLEYSHPPLGERYRLGPFDRLFGWRDVLYSYKAAVGGAAVAPPQPLNGSDDIGATVLGARQPRPPSGSVRDQALGYTTFGPYTWMMRQIHNYTKSSSRGVMQEGGGLWATQFYDYMKDIADFKLGYMFPWQLSDRDPKNVHYPQWVAGYPEAIALAATQPQSIKRTAFIVLSISSRFPREDPQFLSPGSYVTNSIGGQKSPAVYPPGGWVDPNTQDRWQRLCDYIWFWTPKNTPMRSTPWDAIGLTIPVDANGNPVKQPVYIVRYFVFVGIDVGQDMEVRNPANWTVAEMDKLPGPILIDLSHGDYNMRQTHDQGVRRDAFTYLGVCQADNAAMAWPQRFGRPGPYDSVVGLSQAEIFNTTSWDLWTQDWKVKLTPVSNVPDWVKKLAADSPRAADTQGQIRSEDVDKVQQYLDKFDPAMVNEMMQH